MSIYFKIREILRMNPFVQRLIYTLEGLFVSPRSELIGLIKRRKQFVPACKKGIAICARIKDEAPYLSEWLDYYRAAGIDHFFIYESYSSDNFRGVLQPYIDKGIVTLIADWPYIPVDPYAEHDCVLRSIGRFEWVGILDIDEFLLIADGSSIGEFLSRFPNVPAVAFHMYNYGTSGHKQKPTGAVIREYTLRQSKPNIHVKVFIRPEEVTYCRNAHSWHYLGGRTAISEAGKRIYGSFSKNPTVQNAWISHFLTRSEEEYIARMRKKEAVDWVAMKFQRRSEAGLMKSLSEWNQIEDLSVQNYYRRRCEVLSISPDLLHPKEDIIVTTPRAHLAGFQGDYKESAKSG